MSQHSEIFVSVFTETPRIYLRLVSENFQLLSLEIVEDRIIVFKLTID